MSLDIGGRGREWGAGSWADLMIDWLTDLDWLIEGLAEWLMDWLAEFIACSVFY